MSNIKNELLQKYISSKCNHVICLDISYFSKKTCYFIGVYLATRVIVGDFFKTTFV